MWHGLAVGFRVAKARFLGCDLAAFLALFYLCKILHKFRLNQITLLVSALASRFRRAMMRSGLELLFLFSFAEWLFVSLLSSLLY